MIHKPEWRTSVTLRTLAVTTAAAFVAVPPLANSDSAQAETSAATQERVDGPVGSEARRYYHAAQRRVRKRKKAKLVLTLGAPKKVRPGATYTWPVSVTNRGKATAKGAVVSFPLPRSLKLVSASMKCSWQSARVVCKVGTLKKGKVAKGTLTATVQPNVRPGMAIVPNAETNAKNAKAGAAAFPVSTVIKGKPKAGPAIGRPKAGTKAGVKAGPVQKRKGRPGRAELRHVKPKRGVKNRPGMAIPMPKKRPGRAPGQRPGMGLPGQQRPGVAPGRELPQTGVPVQVMVGSAALLVWIGLVCVAVSQIRRRQPVR